ncbi:hypothetical protein [Metabacillus sp. Hm71]|uniref:hypothetical protein n=1 Tax=Metabacillus sp. Hm71 TaxID=3450743 RepID=UPI003F426EDC
MGRRKFRVGFLRREHGTGIGIIETDGNETVYIASIYTVHRERWNDAVNLAIEHVSKLISDETAVIRVNGGYRREIHLNPQNIRIRNCERKNMLAECFELANDAIERRTTITEKLQGEL